MRRILFWTHLSLGVAAGLVILLLAVTGAVLSFEHQILRFAAFQNAAVSDSAPPLSVSDLARAALDATNGRASALTIESDPTLPATASAGRGQQVLLDPATGAVLDGAPAWLSDAFGTVEALHRWLALTGDARDSGRAVTGAANLVFFALLVSGVYLWWPRAWRWRLLRHQMWFRTGLPNTKARDYNWHHVLGFWALIPLFVIVLSGVVLAYPSARGALFALYDETPGRRPAVSQEQHVADPRLDAVYDAALQDGSWNRISLSLPSAAADTVDVEFDRGTGRDPTARTTVTYDLDSADILQTRGFADQSPGMRAFLWMRFGHTGEYYGIVGQAVAGLASIAAAVMVYTGLALSWRRLIVPLWRRRRPV